MPRSGCAPARASCTNRSRPSKYWRISSRKEKKFSSSNGTFTEPQSIWSAVEDSLTVNLSLGDLPQCGVVTAVKTPRWVNLPSSLAIASLHNWEGVRFRYVLLFSSNLDRLFSRSYFLDCHSPSSVDMYPFPHVRLITLRYNMLPYSGNESLKLNSSNRLL